MKMFRLSLIGMLLMIVLIACSSNDKSDQETNDNSNDNETSQENAETEPADTEDEEDESADDNEGSGEEINNEEYLSLGETGEVTGVLGNYEITVNSFEIIDEIEGEPSLMDVLVLVKFEVTNIDDSPIVGKDVYNGRLFNDEDSSQGNLYDFESVKMLTEEEIEPGETVEAEMIFDQNNSDYYELVFNFGALESNATILTWRFDADEAS
ncbi:protein of unknown function [Gracilibacillus orientalis]|uniref:DUF4352 domain-containing protein n=1 Tax=Gracilibacillus orientalis TaxID=334253 RepID=A0A1I4P5D8_9BACI|nr:hypothetical protein [Gracilibacillus orientalis]SFM22949.1 protein of unknown function [Gracilibacillus orientalis]